MRKLDKKNKTFIIALSVLAILLFAAIIVFIFVTIGKTTIKYNIDNGTVIYNANGELVAINEDTYAKRNVFDKYYVLVNEKKVSVGSKPVFYNQKTRELKLLGNFYEISKNGNVSKLSGETIIDNASKSRIFKLSDRKYLVVSAVIRTEDNSLHTNDYLLIDIDKAGNAYLYNNKISIKTFSDLNIITDGYTFDVSDEFVIIEGEKIDLAKIGGSTNEHVRVDDSNEGNIEGGGSGNGGAGEGNNGGNNTIVNDIVEPEIVEKYVSRKTTITGIDTTEKEIKIEYVVYDPFAEYEEVYVNLYDNNHTFVGKYNLGLALTNQTIESLKAQTEYSLEFYYSYKEEDGTIREVQFDTAKVTTKNIKASLTLEKVSDSVVRYILIVEGGYRLDSANVEMYIDDVLVGKDEVNTVQAASKGGYKGTIDYEGTGEFVTLKLTDCIYNGADTLIEASYKYKF